MAWLISRAIMEAYENSHCLQAQAVEFSGGTCSGGEPSAQSSTSPTPDAYSSPDRMMALSRLSRFGMTFEPLTVDRGAGVLMWCLAGSHVRTPAALERAPDSKAPGLDSGWRWPASFAKFNPGSSLWKTRQCSLLGGLESYSETWPRWGSMRSGECLERTTLAPRIGASVSGLSGIPTPTKGDAKGSGSRNTEGSKAHAGVSLTDYVRGDGGRGRERWPTPSAQDSEHAPGNHAARKGRQKMLAHAMGERGESGGQLNPTWVAWLMGWPLGWTDFVPLVTDKSRQWLRSHGACCPSEAGGHD